MSISANQLSYQLHLSDDIREMMYLTWEDLSLRAFIQNTHD